MKIKVAIEFEFEIDTSAESDEFNEFDESDESDDIYYYSDVKDLVDMIDDDMDNNSFGIRCTGEWQYITENDSDYERGVLHHDI